MKHALTHGSFTHTNCAAKNLNPLKNIWRKAFVSQQVWCSDSVSYRKANIGGNLNIRWYIKWSLMFKKHFIQFQPNLQAKNDIDLNFPGSEILLVVIPAKGQETVNYLYSCGNPCNKSGNFPSHFSQYYIQIKDDSWLQKYSVYCNCRVRWMRTTRSIKQRNYKFGMVWYKDKYCCKSDTNQYRSKALLGMSTLQINVKIACMSISVIVIAYAPDAERTTAISTICMPTFVF